MPKPATAQIDITQIDSARPQATAELMAKTGLDEAMLKQLVDGFYGRVRDDAMLGPIFEEKIKNWPEHLETMVKFWSSVALMTGHYHGAPMPKHLPLPVDIEHFQRWLTLFRLTAREVCPPAGAAWVIERAERIATSMHMGIESARARESGADTPPQL